MPVISSMQDKKMLNQKSETVNQKLVHFLHKCHFVIHCSCVLNHSPRPHALSENLGMQSKIS